MTAAAELPRGKPVYEMTLWKYNLAENCDRVWQIRVIPAGSNERFAIVRRWGRRRDKDQKANYQARITYLYGQWGAVDKASELAREQLADGYFEVKPEVVQMAD